MGSSFRACSAGGVVSHLQPLLVRARSVLWVLTGTHPCDDPPRQDGEPPERQLVHCVVACAVGVA